MSWVITGSEATPRDPYLYTNTVLLMHGDGVNGSTTALDSSKVAGGPKSFAPVGNAQISTAIADPFGNSAKGVMAFDGNGDYFQTPAHPDLDLGASNFTIELWARLIGHPSSYSGSYASGLIGQDSGASLGWGLIIEGAASQTLSFTLTHGSATRTTIAGTVNFQLNTWYHIAAVRYGNLIYLFVNGTMVNGTGTSYSQTVRSSNVTVKVGCLGFPGYEYWLNGYIDELRFTKAARYTANFAPPTTPFPDF